jgi:phosphoenolpyruvate synthase/pyruvate phosphate dikinase
MATLDEIKKLKEQVNAIFRLLDEDKKDKINKDKLDAIDDAINKERKINEQKRIKNKEKWITLLWVPIILLIISSILSWLSKCSYIQLGG